MFNNGAAANADGSRFAILPGPHIVATDHRLYARVAGTTTGFVFAPTGNRAYRGVSGQSRIGIVDTARWVEIDQIATPAAPIGMLKINSTGTTVLAIASGGLLVVPVNVNRPPVLEPLGTTTVNVGQSVTLTTQAVDPDGDAVSFCATGLPAGASFDPATRQLSFTPSAGQAGQNFTVNVYASDGANATTQAATFSVTNPASYPARRIPIAGQAGEVTFNPPSGRLYVTNYDRNRVEVIDVATNARLDPIPVGSSPVGIDVNAAGTKLVVCPSNAHFIQVVDLTLTPPAVSATLPVPDSPIQDWRRPWAVAVTSNDKAIFATWYSGSGWVYLRELDLTTNMLSVRVDAPGGSQSEPVNLRTNGNRSRIMLGNGDISSGPVYLYHAATNSFSAASNTNAFIDSVDANVDSTRFIVSVWPGSRVYDENLTLLGTFTGNARQVAFRLGGTTAYRHAGLSFSPSATVEVLDLNTFLVSGNFTLPEGATGRMRTNSTGTRLFVITATGVCIVTLP